MPGAPARRYAYTGNTALNSATMISIKNAGISHCPAETAPYRRGRPAMAGRGET